MVGREQNTMLIFSPSEGLMLVNRAVLQDGQVAEWLRRWTPNPMGSAGVGSNPIRVGMSFTERTEYLGWKDLVAL